MDEGRSGGEAEVGTGAVEVGAGVRLGEVELGAGDVEGVAALREQRESVSDTLVEVGGGCEHTISLGPFCFWPLGQRA